MRHGHASGAHCPQWAPEAARHGVGVQGRGDHPAGVVGERNGRVAGVERRAEIGLRRALGATRGQIRAQFLSEALLLSALGGAGGALLGSTICALYATSRHWPTVVPAWATLGALSTTLVVGVGAGLYPAVKASNLAPTEALAAP